MAARAIPIMERLWSRVIVAQPDQCWMWAGMAHHGYGQIRDGAYGRKFVHRLVLEEKLGRRLARGEVTMHSCDTRRCCNPAHLSVGTDSENIRDRHAKGRTARGENGSGAKLTAYQVEHVRSRLRAGDSAAALAERLGVTSQTVHNIRLGKTWRNAFWMGGPLDGGKS